VFQPTLQLPAVCGRPGIVSRRTTRALVVCKLIACPSARAATALIFGVCLGTFARAGSDSDPQAAALLRACQTSQSCLDQVSMRIKTVADEKLASGSTAHVQYETYIRRDGMRLDVRSQITPAVDDPMRSPAKRLCMVIKPPLCVSSSCPLSKPDPPMAGIATDDWAQFFAVRGLSRFHGGPLDGYFPPSGTRRIADLMAESPTLYLVKDDQVDGAPCKVVEARTPHGVYTMWLEQGRGCLPRRVMYKLGPEDLHGYWDPIPFSQLLLPGPDGQEHGGTEECGVLEGITYQPMGDALVAVSGKFTRVECHGPVRLGSVYSYTRSDIRLRPHFDGTDAFVSDLPEGARITNLMDSRSGVRYEWRRGKVVIAGTGNGGEIPTYDAEPDSQTVQVGMAVCCSWSLSDATAVGETEAPASSQGRCCENGGSCSSRDGR
jgi:hypothetical protein